MKTGNPEPNVLWCLSELSQTCQALKLLRKSRRFLPIACDNGERLRMYRKSIGQIMTQTEITTAADLIEDRIRIDAPLYGMDTSGDFLVQIGKD